MNDFSIALYLQNFYSIVCPQIILSLNSVLFYSNSQVSISSQSAGCSGRFYGSYADRYYESYAKTKKVSDMFTAFKVL